MDVFLNCVKDFNETKSSKSLEESFKQALNHIQSASDKRYNESVKNLCEGGLLNLINSSYKNFDKTTKISTNKIISLASKSSDFNASTDAYIPFLLESLKENDKEIIISALEAETQVVINAPSAMEALFKYDVLSTNKMFFNRKIDIDILTAAAELMGELFKHKPQDQVFSMMTDALLYCVTHINLKIIHLGIKAAKNLVIGSPQMADLLIKISFYDDIYAQFRHPSNPVKTEILALFTETAKLGPRFQKFVREHTISDRISAFLCHYNDEVCMQCLELLDTLDLSVKTSIEYKYIITLILHISMSGFEFKKKSFDLLEKYLYKADASQIRIISDEGYIRPFLTLACDSNTISLDKERILNLIKYLIDKFDILKIRIVQFDFDHAHNAEEFSCVNQLMQLMEENSSNIKVTVSYILDCLQKIGIVNNMSQN